VDKGLRLLVQSAILVRKHVSILGLVDKGLRLGIIILSHESHPNVSILGLVDKGLRLKTALLSSALLVCFNPWFSG